MIIGISGKINSGKDTVGKIIQILKNSPHFTNEAVVGCLDRLIYTENNFIIKKFADTLKDIVCLLIGCTREQLEDREFKEKSLGEEWTQYAYAIGHRDIYLNGKTSKEMISKFCTKEVYEYEKAVNWQTAYKQELTPRLLLQLLGTECGRNIIHPNIWVNALMSEYKNKSTLISEVDYLGDSRCGICKKPTKDDSYFLCDEHIEKSKNNYPNWIITDTRFPNEAEAIKDRNGILIRVNRKQFVEYEGKIVESFNVHPSESGLDNYKDFNYVIENDGTLLDLVDNVKIILQKENII